MENQSKYIMIERNKFAALVKVHRKCLQILSILTYAHTMPWCALKTPGMPLENSPSLPDCFYIQNSIPVIFLPQIRIPQAGRKTAGHYI